MAPFSLFMLNPIWIWVWNIFNWFVMIMVLIVDGNSEHVAHACEEREVFWKYFLIRDGCRSKQKPYPYQIIRFRFIRAYFFLSYHLIKILWWWYSFIFNLRFTLNLQSEYWWNIRDQKLTEWTLLSYCQILDLCFFNNLLMKLWDFKQQQEGWSKKSGCTGHVA